MTGGVAGTWNISEAIVGFDQHRAALRLRLGVYVADIDGSCVLAHTARIQKMTAIRKEHGIDREEVVLLRHCRHGGGGASGRRHAQDAAALRASQQDYAVAAPGAAKDRFRRLADLLDGAACHIDFFQLSLNQLHHIVVWSDVVYRADVRMAQGSDCAHFAIEPFAELFMGNLQGYIAAHARIMGPIHLAHSTGADHIQDLIRSQLFARARGHDPNSVDVFADSVQRVICRTSLRISPCRNSLFRAKSPGALPSRRPGP